MTIMKKYLSLSLFAIGLSLNACSSGSSNSPTNDPGTFTIVGKWGMVSGTTTDKNGATTRYPAHASGAYYQYETYYPDGTFVRNDISGGELTRGV